MQNLAYKHKISVKEVEISYLRFMCKQMGFTCNHEDIRWSKPKKPKDRPAYAKVSAIETSRPFCSNCYTFMQMTKQATYNFQGKLVNPAEYAPLDNFLDDWEKDQKLQAEFQARTKPEVQAKEG